MISYVVAHILPAASALLPTRMRSDAATAMLVAIGLQESQFAYRRQWPTGPARGFWQFESGGGVRGVLTHRSTARLAQQVVVALQYRTLEPAPIHVVLEHNDILAAAFARLLLWTLPDPLPTEHEPSRGWDQYLQAWRPGKPHPQTWLAHFREGWRAHERTES